MSRLQDEPLSKVVDNGLIEATMAVEKVFGTVQCDACGYWGRMDGFLEPNDKKRIKFVCPECNCVELVDNPEFGGS